MTVKVSYTPQYEVDEHGSVWSTTSNWRGYGRRELKQIDNGKGYLKVRIVENGKRVNRAVHCLVAAKFLPPRPSQTHEIRHLDGNRHNNCASNLAWGTRKDNADDREKHGRTSRGPQHAAAIKRGWERTGFLNV